MNNRDQYFYEGLVKEVSDEMNLISKKYAQLFVNLSSQIFIDIIDLDDVSEIVSVCDTHVETAFSLFAKYFNYKEAIDCKKGCAYCCYFPVITPPQIIIHVANRINNQFNPEERENLLIKLRDYIGKSKDLIRDRIRCPFLDEENSCTIYDYRPLSCRSFTSGDVNNCEKSIQDKRSIDQDPVRYQIYQAATSSFVAYYKKKNMPFDQFPFIKSLFEVMECKKQNKTKWKDFSI